MQLQTFVLISLATFSLALPPVFIKNDRDSEKISRKFGLPNIGRIINGTEARPHSLPYQVAIESLDSNDEWTIAAVGVILTPNMILSSASGIYFAVMDSKIRILAGDHDRSVDEGTEQAIEMNRFFPHAQFDLFNQADYDYGVIRLASNLTFNEWVQPAPIPKAGQESKGECSVAGWGALNYDYEGDDLTFPETLQQIQTNMEDWDECFAIMGGMGFPLSERYICTKVEEDGRSPAAGDSGAPLVCKDEEGNDYVAGLTLGTFGPFGTYPVMYSGLAYVRPWIDSFIITN